MGDNDGASVAGDNEGMMELVDDGISTPRPPRKAQTVPSDFMEDRPMPTSSKWRNLRAMGAVPIQAELHETLATVRIKNQAVPAQGSPFIIREVESEEELRLLPLWQQANADLVTAAAIRARSHLRSHPDVVNELQRWWDVAQRLEDGDSVQHDAYVQIMQRTSSRGSNSALNSPADDPRRS